MKYLILLIFVLPLANGCGMIKGEKGDPGANGKDGTDGTNGANGVDATPVTLVKLCPGDTVYASSFPEYALCINDELYAIYSSVAALVKIPPGTYSSSSAGSSCAFTVVDGCEIQN